MQKNLIFIFFISVFIIFLDNNLFSKNIGLISVYGGSLGYNQEYKAKGTKTSDDGFLKGIYGQYISDKYQFNFFGYNTDDMDFSKIKGLHSNFDFYFKNKKSIKYLSGFVYENIDVKVSAYNRISNLYYFGVDKNINIYLLRFGLIYKSNYKNINYRILPYIGKAYFNLDGNVVIDPYGPPPKIVSDISQKNYYWVIGSNLNLSPLRFIEFQIKYSFYFKNNKNINNSEIMLNFFLNKSIGISYRYKFLDLNISEIENKIKYNMFGIVYLFDL